MDPALELEDAKKRSDVLPALVHFHATVTAEGLARWLFDVRGSKDAQRLVLRGLRRLRAQHSAARFAEACASFDRAGGRRLLAGFPFFGIAIAALGPDLPPDLRHYFARGFSHPHASVPSPFGAIGFEFLDAEAARAVTEDLRGAAKELPDDDPHSAVLRAGVAVTGVEPHLVVAPGGVYHVSFRNPLLHVAPTFAIFLEHYLAAGCFASHSFPAIYAAVSKLVPRTVEPAKNLWLRAYERQFPSYFRSPVVPGTTKA